MIVRLKPSNPTEPSATARNRTEPGTCSAPASPVSGTRSRIRPSRATKRRDPGDVGEQDRESLARAVHVSRPKASIPKSATYE